VFSREREAEGVCPRAAPPKLARRGEKTRPKALRAIGCAHTMMKFLIDTYTHNGFSHHAYVIEGEKEKVFPSLCDMLEKECEFRVAGNPDFFVLDTDVFGIDEGRAIKDMYARKPFAHPQKIFMIMARLFTVEAQNALLKMFEDGGGSSCFFVIVPRADALLPTLRSRLFSVACEADANTETEMRNLVSEFLKLPRPARAKLFVRIVKEKDRASAASFVNELEIAMKGLVENSETRDIYAKSLKDVLACRNYLSRPGAPIKMILEHLSIAIPER